MKVRELVITVRIEDQDDVTLEDSIVDAQAATKDALEEQGFEVQSIAVTGHEVSA